MSMPRAKPPDPGDHASHQRRYGNVSPEDVDVLGKVHKELGDIVESGTRRLAAIIRGKGNDAAAVAAFKVAYEEWKKGQLELAAAKTDRPATGKASREALTNLLAEFPRDVVMAAVLKAHGAEPEPTERIDVASVEKV